MSTVLPVAVDQFEPRVGRAVAHRWPLMLPLLGGVAGLLLAVTQPNQFGRTHSCPLGASLSACNYPADLTAQRVSWAVCGLLIGLLLMAGVSIVRFWRSLD